MKHFTQALPGDIISFYINPKNPVGVIRIKAKVLSVADTSLFTAFTFHGINAAIQVLPTKLDDTVAVPENMSEEEIVNELMNAFSDVVLHELKVWKHDADSMGQLAFYATTATGESVMDAIPNELNDLQIDLYVG